MSMKSKLMTSAAALTLITGAAMADQHTAASPENTGEYAAGWNESLDNQYGDIADTQIAELIGMNVVSDQGDDVGEVDNFVLMDDELKAVVGVGGFLGLGEHEVALSLSDMTYNGENLVVAFTKEELEAMPEYTDELEARTLAETDTFRTRQMSDDGTVMETAGVEGATGGMVSDAETSSVEGEELAQDGEATIETDETAGQEMAESDGEMNIDAEQTAEADSMENAEEQVEEQMADAGADEMENSTDANPEMAGTQLEEDPSEATEGEAVAEVDPGTPEDASPTGEEVAAAEDAAEDAGMDGDTMTEEVAENEQGEIEQEAEELVAEAGNAAEDAGNAIEGAADAAGQELAEAADATENAVEGAAVETAAAVDNAAEETGDWMANFADIADWQINEIEGKDVASTDGNVIGEVDDLARQDGKLVALVGIGGFLGLGEHDVALDMSNLTWDGEKFVAEGYTEEDLRAMNEYDAETVEMLDDDITLNDANM